MRKGDEIIVHAGNVIPFDGVVTTGDATVNQASLTGESVPVCKKHGLLMFMQVPYVEEGELTILCKSSRKC